MAATAATPAPEKPPVKYFELARQAIFNCPGKKFMDVKPSAVFDLIGIERKYKVPDSLRGILLTMDCLKKQVVFKDFRKLRHWKKDISKVSSIKSILDIKSKNPVKHSRFNKNNFKKTADIMLRRVTAQIPTDQKGSLREKWLKAWIRSLQIGTAKKVNPQRHLLLLKKWHNKAKKSQKKEEDGCTC